MALAFETVHKSLRPGGVFALVVGRNRTMLGGESILIDTPRLLADIACSKGWYLQKEIELDTYHRFDIHSRNSVRTESLLLLEKR